MTSDESSEKTETITFENENESITLSNVSKEEIETSVSEKSEINKTKENEIFTLKTTSSNIKNEEITMTDMMTNSEIFKEMTNSFSPSEENDTFIELNTTNPKKKGIPIGAIIGIVCGIIALIVVISVLIFFFIYKKQKKPNNQDQQEEISNKKYTNVETKTNKSLSEDEDDDLDFWL